jgi:hypothetical protein
MRSVICLAAFALACLPAFGGVETGVNGHPLSQEGYLQAPIAGQLDLVKRLGARWYRTDWGSDAPASGAGRAEMLVREAARRGLQVLPVIFPPVDMAKDTEASIRQAARDYARALAIRFKGRVTVWELHNELDSYAMIRKGEKNARGEVWQWGDADGQLAEHFEEGRYARARAVLLGLAEGIREGDPTARRLINSSGWLHFGFIQRLVADGVPFEILGWHWYSEMGDITSAAGVNALARITAFGKPIWINEYNRRGGNGGDKGEAEQATVLAAMTQQFAALSATYPIRALMAYELLDEPYFGPDNPESHYGLVGLRKDAAGRWEPAAEHPVFAALAKEYRALQSGKANGAAQNPSIDVPLRRSSNAIPASPFATLTSFEVHGEDEDAGVVASMRALGVKWVMMHNIHGSLPDPADRRLNNWLRMCKEAGIGVRCILASRDLELWRNAVRNYGDRITAWHFLNEPNAPTDTDHTRPNVAPEAYVAEARAVRDILRAERPGTRLFGPETAMLQCMEEQPYPWLRKAFEAGLANAVDGFSIHPYRQAYSPSNIPENPSTFEGRPGTGYRTYEEQVAALRRMAPGKPIAVTEVGWSTAPLGRLNGSTRERISELTQAKFALRQQIQDFAMGVEVATYFLLRERHDNAPFQPGHIENQFGIVHPDNRPKPACTALQTLYAQLDSRCKRDTRTPVKLGTPGVKWYLFEDRSGRVPTRKLVYWQPIAARDDCPVLRTSVTLAGVQVRGVPLSDAPRILRLHQIKSRWTSPCVVDLMAQRVEWLYRTEAGRRKRGLARFASLLRARHRGCGGDVGQACRT